jgi:hypothetical protein
MELMRMRSFRFLLGSLIWLSFGLIAIENFFLFSLWVIAPGVWHDLAAGHGQLESAALGGHYLPR